jgi:methylated-DNA-[protein]-cysteine S-methyltransferase
MQCTDEYLCALVFKETEEASQEHPLLVQCREQLDEYFSGSREMFNLPMAQTGTAFQQKVWTLLHTIPFGKTLSYQTLSKQYGDLKAIRAIAAANGRNNLAILVPCHRVIGSNRSLTGYAGGLWRKKWLLEHEAKFGGMYQGSLL